MAEDSAGSQEASLHPEAVRFASPVIPPGNHIQSVQTFERTFFQRQALLLIPQYVYPKPAWVLITRFESEARARICPLPGYTQTSSFRFSDEIWPGPDRTIWQPIHHTLRPYLDPEYVRFHDQYMQYVMPDDLKGWDGMARTHPSLPPGGSVPVKVGRIQDVKLATCTVRVFVPDDNMGDTKYPALLWFHGGGWAIGGLDSENDFCAYVCQSAKTIVVTVDYRLAPEHPYPAAAEDAVEALQWLMKEATKPTSFQVDIDRIAIGGTSAGGNLAAVLILEAACLFRSFKPILQLLIVPVIDNTAIPGKGWLNVNAPWLTPQRMLWYRNMYLPQDGKIRDLSREDWQTSPNLAPKKLHAKCPQTWIAVSEHDLLATEGLNYTRQLRDAGVRADVKVYQGSTHSILALNGVLSRGVELMWDAVYMLSRAIRPQHFAPWPSPSGSC